MSEETKNYNIDINAVAPGAINTGMWWSFKWRSKKIGNYYYQKALKQKSLGGSSYKSACDLILFLGSDSVTALKVN